MSVIAEPSTVLIDDRLAKRNALVLAVAQGLAGGNNTVIVSTGGIVGAMLAPDRGLATLTISTMVFGMWIGTVPVGILSKRYGRRFALQIGTLSGVLAGLICCAAVLIGSFYLFLCGSICAGFYAANHQSYRFAATDTASDAFKPKAIAWVLAGGVAAGFIGPQMVIFTKDLWQPYLFAASYIGMAAIAALAGCVLIFLKIPRPSAHSRANAGRPLGEIARTPRFIVAVVCGVAAYSMMNLVMTSAPLAMVDCGHSITDSTLGLQWHLLGMFAPSFITGSLITRFGVFRIMALGFATIIAAALTEIGRAHV